MTQPHYSQLEDILQAISRIEEAASNARDMVEEYMDEPLPEGLDLDCDIAEIEGGLLDLREVAP